MLRPYCGVEVALTVLKLTETDRQTGRQTSTSKYRDACASKNNHFFTMYSNMYYLPPESVLISEAK